MQLLRKDNVCGSSEWRAANNQPLKRAKLDETGLEIAGCRHGLAQCAVNMYQGELYGYEHYIQRYQMQPAMLPLYGWMSSVNIGNGQEMLVS